MWVINHATGAVLGKVPDGEHVDPDPFRVTDGQWVPDKGRGWAIGYRWPDHVVVLWDDESVTVEHNVDLTVLDKPAAQAAA